MIIIILFIHFSPLPPLNYTPLPIKFPSLLHPQSLPTTPLLPFHIPPTFPHPFPFPLNFLHSSIHNPTPLLHYLHFPSIFNPLSHIHSHSQFTSHSTPSPHYSISSTHSSTHHSSLPTPHLPLTTPHPILRHSFFPTSPLTHLIPIFTNSHTPFTTPFAPTLPKTPSTPISLFPPSSIHPLSPRIPLRWVSLFIFLPKLLSDELFV